MVAALWICFEGRTGFTDGLNAGCKEWESCLGPASDVKAFILSPIPLNIILAGGG